MYVRQLRLNNLRCFESAEIDFQYPGRAAHEASPPQFSNLNLILGDNGSGKTTVLKAVALAILAPALSDSGFRPYFLVRQSNKPKDSAQIWADVVIDAEQEGWMLPDSSGEATVVATIERIGRENRIDQRLSGVITTEQGPVVPDGMRVGENSGFLVFGYGATRRSEATSRYDEGSRLKDRSIRHQRVAALFEEHYSLTAFSSWLARMSSDNGKPHPHWDTVVRILTHLLRDAGGPEWTHGIVEAEAEFRLPDSLRVPFDALSDGYRAFLAWVGDLLYHMSKVAGQLPLREMTGVVLVDELDLHLHPSWQRRILQSLASNFPRLQFIVTSHSPILAGCLPPENTYLSEGTSGGAARIRRASESVYGHEVNEILYNPDYFGLTTTVPPSLEEEVAQERDRRMELARRFLAERDVASARDYLESLARSDDSHPGH